MTSYFPSRINLIGLLIITQIFITCLVPLHAAELFHQTFALLSQPATAPVVASGNAVLPLADSSTPASAATPASMAAATGMALERETQDAQHAATPPTSDDPNFQWPADDAAFKALNPEQRRQVWDHIKEAREDRSEPTTRGPWFDAHNREDRMARIASDSQYATILAQSLSMYDQGQVGQEDAARGAKAVIATGAATVFIKKTFRRRRPYPNDDKYGSFPSGHTSTVFAMAAVFGSSQPQQRVMALGAASVVGWARVKVRAHHWNDVLAGGALGYAIGRHYAPDSSTPHHQDYPVASVQITF